MDFRTQYFKSMTFGLVLLCTILSGRLYGQYKYETFSTAQGLSQGYIWDMLQDKDGFLWMTTKAGVNRYDGYSFKVYGYDAFDAYSISHNSTFFLYEDSKGRMWVGSEYGYNIFDKHTDKFYRLLHDPKNTNSISGNKAYEQITELADGRFLVNTSNIYFDVVTLGDDFFKNEKNIKIDHIRKPKNSFNEFNLWNEVIYTDAKGITWYRCDGKVYKFNPKTNIFEPQSVKFINGVQIIKNEDGSVWSNDEYVSLYDGANIYPTFTKPIYEGHTGAMLIEDNGRIWRANNNIGFLEIFDASKWEKGHPLDPDKCKIVRMDHMPANALIKDKTGLVWAGLNGHGLRKFSFESEKFNLLAKDFSVTKIVADAQNKLYISTYSGNFSFGTDGKPIINHWGLSDFYKVKDYFISQSGDLWITKRSDSHTSTISSFQQINLSTKQSKIFDTPFKGDYNHHQHTVEDKSGRLWIAGIGGDFAVFDTKSGDFREFTINVDKSNPLSLADLSTCQYIDHSGTVWMGTQLGFAKIESKNVFITDPKITWYRNDPRNRASLNNNNVSTFLDDPIDNNLLWIGTKGGGLNLMEKSTGRIRHITTQNGLCNNTVYGILSDEMGNIWGSTNNGLFCILSSKDRSGDFEIRHFTEAAGLQAAEFNTDAYAKLPNGHLAFGGIKGVNVFDPKEILVDTFAPNVFITKLEVGNKLIKSDDASKILTHAIEFTQSITLLHDQDVFTLEFSSLDFRAPDQIKYRYQMVGVDDNWIESGNRRSVTYSHLPSGTYSFKVQGSNSLGIWNEKVRELTIKILPPWYASWWAYLIYATLLGLGIRAYYKYKLHENKMATQLLFEQNESHRIKELDKIKTHLYTNMTHEFRTPLTVILGMVQQIRRSTSDYLDNGLDMIERNGNNLLKLVNEMLDLSKLEAGKMELNLIEGDVINFIRYIVESFHSMAEAQDKKMHYLSNIDAAYAKYDAEKLRQIITNLLSNALKFTSKKGDIYVTVSWENDAKTQLSIKVKDTGVGIPENQIHRVFDRFYQADSTHTRNAEGTGIGLALTKELVQLMDGTISVKSPPVGAKKGSEFTVILPLQISFDYKDTSEVPGSAKIIKTQVATDDQPTHISNQNMSQTDKELILLVEDNADVVAYTASCLQEYRLAVGKDGQEGYDIACDLVPDLIITDVMMPFMDGFEMTRHLRQDERTSHIPIIMLTAKADLDSRLEGIEYGAEVYIEKPFNKDELVLRVRKLLEQRAILQKAYARLIGLQPAIDLIEKSVSDTPNIEQVAIPDIENEFVKKVTAEIELHMSNEAFTVDHLSKNLFMSYSQLHRKLSAVIGLSPNQYIRHLRLQKSKQLLRDTDDTIFNISMICGFSDPSYFGKVFKQEFGITAQEFRNG